MKRRPRMLLKLGVFLLLGAIFNVAVAWGLNMQTVETPHEQRLADGTDVDWWTSHAPADISHGPSHTFANDQLGRECVIMFVYRTETLENDALGDCVTRYRFGWPWSSMECATWLDHSKFVFVEQNQLHLPGWRKGSTPLAWMPLWPGFAINTIFYAAMLWLLWIAPRGPGKVRRLVRVRQHRCPACAYLIAPGTCANGLCSECGAALPWVRDKVESGKVES